MNKQIFINSQVVEGLPPNTEEVPVDAGVDLNNPPEELGVVPADEVLTKRDLAAVVVVVGVDAINKKSGSGSSFPH